MSTAFGPESCQLTCPSCRSAISSDIKYKSTTRTHIMALILCAISCIPCALCLYCTGCARNVEHYCPSCKTFLGVYQR